MTNKIIIPLSIICVILCFLPYSINAGKDINERELFAMEMFFQNEDIYGPARIQLTEKELQELNDFAISNLKIIAVESQNLDDDAAEEYIMSKIYAANGLKERLTEKVKDIIDAKSGAPKIKNFIPQHLITKKNIILFASSVIILFILFILFLKFIARSKHPLKFFFTILLIFILFLFFIFKKFKSEIFKFTDTLFESSALFNNRESNKNIYYVKQLNNKEYAQSLLSDIQNAQKSIYVSMYLAEYEKNRKRYATSIINALCDAADRGVKIFVMLEQPAKNENPDLHKKNSAVKAKLDKHKIKTKWDSPFTENHEKIVLIDEQFLYIGNHNWSIASLEDNEEIAFKIVTYRFDAEILNYFKNIFAESQKSREFSDVSVIQKELIIQDEDYIPATDFKINETVIETEKLQRISDLAFLPGYLYYIKLKNELATAVESVDIDMFLIRPLRANLNDPVYHLMEILKELHNRGVKINLTLDTMLKDENIIAFEYFKAIGIPVKFYEGKNIMHRKFINIDGKKIFCGSHNWTNSAFNSNREVSAYIELEDSNL